MLPPSENFAPTPKTLIRASALLLFAATIFGVLNIAKVKTLRSATIEAVAARDSAERNRAKQEKELNARESAVAVLQAGADSVAIIADLLPEENTKLALRARTEEWVQLLKK